MHRGRQLPCNQKRKEIELSNPALRTFRSFVSLPSTSLSISKSKNKNSPLPFLKHRVNNPYSRKKRNYFLILFHLLSLCKYMRIFQTSKLSSQLISTSRQTEVTYFSLSLSRESINQLPRKLINIRIPAWKYRGYFQRSLAISTLPLS